MPVDRSRVRRLITQHVKWLRWVFQLNQWEVNTSIQHLDGGASATCEALSKYRVMHLKFDAEQLHSDKEVFNALRHELIHGMLAEFDLLYEAVKRVAPSSEFEILDVLYHNATERSVGNIERMIDYGLGLEHTKLIDRAKQVCKEQA